MLKPHDKMTAKTPPYFYNVVDNIKEKLIDNTGKKKEKTSYFEHRYILHSIGSNMETCNIAETMGL